MGEPTGPNKFPLTETANNLTSISRIDGVFLGIENLRTKLKLLPHEGVLYRVEFGIADITSDDFLKDPDRFPNMWSEHGYRGVFPCSESLTKEGLINYLTTGANTLPQQVVGALQRGIPFGIRIRAWQKKDGLNPDVIEREKGEVVEIANATIARNLR